MTIAEESTAWPGVTQPVEAGGLGFSYKWNMGWMHDTLRYVEEDPINRRWHHDDMTFGMVYAYSERFVLPISHDEVVHGKGSLINKMPGDDWQKHANLRAYLSFMWTHPGKKLLFMGCEIADYREWNHDASPNWDLLDVPRHRGLQRLVRDLNHLYASSAALHELDADAVGLRMDRRRRSREQRLRVPSLGSRPVARDGGRRQHDAGRARRLPHRRAARRRVARACSTATRRSTAGRASATRERSGPTTARRTACRRRCR